MNQERSHQAVVAALREENVQLQALVAAKNRTRDDEAGQRREADQKAAVLYAP